MTPLAHKSTKTVAKIKIGIIWFSAIILALPNGIFHNFDIVEDIYSQNGVKPFCTPEEVTHALDEYDYENEEDYNTTIFGQNYTNQIYSDGIISSEVFNAKS